MSLSFYYFYHVIDYDFIPERHFMKKLFVSTILLNISIFALLFFLFPSLNVTLTGEDMVIETLTAILFFGSALLGLFFFFKLKEKKGRYTSLFIFLFGGLLFLEEISFGERIFNLPMPEVGGGKVDGVHDVFRMAAFKIKVVPTSLLVIGGLVAVAAVIALVIKYKEKLLALRTNIATYLPFLFLIVCGAFLASGIFFDLGLVRFYSFHLWEEISEMSAGLTLVFSAVSVYQTRSTQRVLPALAITTHPHKKETIEAIAADQQN